MKIAVTCLSFFLLSFSLFAQNGNYPPVIKRAEEMVYKNASDTDLKLWMFKPEGWQSGDNHPAIVFFFGGGWSSGSPTQFVPHAEYLAKRGMIAFVADYRVKSRHGVQAKYCVQDARDAITYVRTNAAELGVDPNRIASGGGSAGGHLAACVGVLKVDAGSKANAMALFNPAVILAPIEGMRFDGQDRSAGLKERMGVDPIELSPYHHITNDAPPCVIFHGTKDSTVPFKTVELFTDRMGEVGVECTLNGYEGEGHGFFNASRKGSGGKEPAFPKTLKQLDAFFVELGWLE